MARTAGGPRVRYIAFRIQAERPVERKELIEALRRAGGGAPEYAAAEPWLTRYDGTLGIVRCHHHGVEATRTALGALERVPTAGGDVPVRIETLATSGTIRTLTEGPLKDLRDTGRRR